MKKRKIFSILLLFGLLILITSCSMDDITYIVKNNNHTHDYNSEWCVDENRHWNECKCGDKINSYTHVYSDWIIIKDSTEYKVGSKKQICFVCKYENEVEIPIKDAHVHNYSKEYYYDTSYHWNECSCGERTNVKEHSYGDWIIIEDSTEYKVGSKKQICYVCKYENEVEIPIKNTHVHNYSKEYYNDTSYHWNECSCGQRANVEKHSYGDWIIIEDSTEYNVGSKKQVCLKCMYENIEEIPKKDVSEGLTYAILSDDTYEVTGIGTYAGNDIIIPDTYNGKKVTRIGSNAFNYCDNITSIKIPDSVTSIGSNAFNYCKNLTNISLSSNLNVIEAKAFYKCTSLTEIIIPDNVTSIGEYAFYYCSSLTNVSLPSNLTSIESRTFYRCIGLINIIIPDNVTSIGSNAFYYCNNLTSVVIPTSVTTISDRAFYGNYSLNSIYYKGTPSEWSNIVIGLNNTNLSDGFKYYYSDNKPIDTEYLYWHYVNNEIEIW